MMIRNFRDLEVWKLGKKNCYRYLPINREIPEIGSLWINFANEESSGIDFV